MQLKIGKADFICTNYSHFFIRDNSLKMIHSQRSCDAIYGLAFDFPWNCYVYQTMFHELKKVYTDLQPNVISYHIDSLHVYTRHKHLIEQYISA